MEAAVSLKNYNTFGIDVSTPLFVSVNSEKALKEVLQDTSFKNALVIGGGSNMLLTKNLLVPVIHIALKGIERCNETQNHVFVKVLAGENWHEFVLYCIAQNLGGVENLAYIPGNVGTAPIQNIGAYGVELKDVFYSCTAMHRQTATVREFTLEECDFGYRNSVFKTQLKDQYVITSVTFKLTTQNHKLHTAYGAIQETLGQHAITAPTIKDVADAVIKIRKSKLPNPAEIGNSGSFFKNPVVSARFFSLLKAKFEDIPHYKVANDQIKVPAGWLIEQAGFKGKRFGDAGVHHKQALVLVNFGNASGEEIWNLAMRIQKVVFEKFGIRITPEVNVI